MFRNWKILSICLFAATLGVQSVKAVPQLVVQKNAQLVGKDLLLDSDFENFRVSFSIYDGKLKKQLALLGEKIDDKHIKFTHDQLQWDVTLESRAKAILFHSKIKNKTSKPLWLEPAIHIQAKTSAELLTWDGVEKHPLTSKPMIREGIKTEPEERFGASWTQPFPVVSVGGKKSSLFIGSVFGDPVSYTASSVLNDSDKKTKLKYSLRIVAEPDKTQVNRFVLGTVSNKYGDQESIVQAYYDSFPESWKIHVTQDNPYVWGAHAHYLNYWWKPDFEQSRRLYITLEWGYAPYKRSGDIVCKPELWDYKQKGVFKKKKYFGNTVDYSNLSHETFVKNRRKWFREYAQDFGIMYFNSVSGTWCESQLAEKKYPDAIVNDTSRGVRKVVDSWSTHHDNEVRVFPMGTTFSKVIRDDMKYLAEDLKLPGFSFDCCVSGAYYRGPATQKNIPGKAWDEEGVFIDQGVAINNLVDFVHNLKKPKGSKEPYTVWGNGWLKSDYIMVEASFLNPLIHDWFPVRRYLQGPRPGSTHKHGFQFDQTISNWMVMDQNDFKQVVGKLADYIIFNEFQYGLTDSYLTQFGNPQITYNMPEVIELMRAGWQSLIPLAFNDQGRKIYSARYGHGENSYLFIGNPYSDNMNTKLTIGNQELGEMQYIFVRKMRDHAQTDNKFEKGCTEIETVLTSRTPILYEAVCGIDSDAVLDFNCTVKSVKDLNRQIFVLNFDNAMPVNIKISPKKIRQFKMARATVNGKMVLLDHCRLPIGGELVLTYESERFHVSQEQLAQFDFMDSRENVIFNILVNDRSDSDAMNIANRIQGYFDYCISKKIINEKSERVEILDETAGKNELCVLVGPSLSSKYSRVPNGISLKDSVLYFKAKDLADAKMLYKEFGYVLDEQFPYVYPFKPVMGLYEKHLKYFKMNGKSLTHKKYFQKVGK